MKAACCQARRLFIGLVAVTVVCFALAPVLSAQGTDPGPRPPGTTPTPTSVCSTVVAIGNDKFNDSTLGNPFCFDQDQPASTPPQPPATGAGQIITNPVLPIDTMWFQALTVFSATAIVSPSSSVTPSSTITGLGPSFNALSCFGCHAEPAVGGASPGVVTVNGNKEATTLFPGVPFTNVTQNPEFIAANAESASNTLPCFLVPPTAANGGCPGITLGDFPAPLYFGNGPVVEVRFVKTVVSTTPNVDPVTGGSVANLFTIETRSDNSPGCSIGQEPITAQILAGNAIFRTPTPTFGLGFVENTSDLTLETNANALSSVKTGLGIVPGVFNRSGNDQTITRFGWKAQNKSLMMFAGEASNVEMGVTNELFTNERTTGSGSNCTPNEQPEDQILGTTPQTDASQISSVLQNNAVFMRLNGAPSQCDWTSTTTTGGVPVCLNLGTNALKGQCLFGSSAATTSEFCSTNFPGIEPYGIGCVLCHSDNLTTSNSAQPGLANQPFAPYSDFALHSMGHDGDGVSQGNAGPTQFRTAPLWGAGQRFFFMHDGRFFNLNNAVKGHCPAGDSTTTPNESCGVINNYLSLSPANETLILEFVRSL
jgi:Di-haem oxidoreductase, putative peroxidase